MHLLQKKLHACMIYTTASVQCHVNVVLYVHASLALTTCIIIMQI